MGVDNLLLKFDTKGSSLFVRCMPIALHQNLMNNDNRSYKISTRGYTPITQHVLKEFGIKQVSRLHKIGLAKSLMCSRQAFNQDLKVAFKMC